MYKQLTSEQRYYIYLERQKGSTQKSIAEAIGVSESTVSRELRRNGGRNGSYNFLKAHGKAMARRHREPGNRAKPPELVWRVGQLIMEEQWSPAQISGYLREKEGIRISHETIYKLIRADRSGKLARNCRHKMKYRKSASHRHETKATNIRNRVSIHERPEEADGTRFGDWEMDTIVDAQANAILTLTERSTNFILIERLPQGRKALPLAKTVVRLLFPYRDHVRTITTDNGSEFAAHRYITEKLTPKDRDDIIVYFADSYCSWQKGSIENANKLIRRYIPKRADFNRITDKYIKETQKKLNARPVKSK